MLPVSPHNTLHTAELVSFAKAMLRADSAGIAKQLLDPVLHGLCQLTELELHPAIFRDTEATDTANGKAVSPITAAQCAEDPERSRVFMQGLYQAITDKVSRYNTAENGRPVQLLYAGTGPFGWLLLPLLPLFSTAQLQVTLLDIHPQSMQRLTMLLQHFNVADRIAMQVVADATQWQPLPQQRFDVILSETMKHMLQQEPQVAIFSHLQQFLAPDGDLIPQQIILSAALRWAQQHHRLGEIFRLSHHSAARLAAGDTQLLQAQFTLPDFEAGPVDLALDTEIVVYNKHRLQQNQCQLTLTQYKKALYPEPGSVLYCNYVQGTYPDWHINITRLQQTLAPSDDLRAGGIFHLYRLWQKTQQSGSHQRQENTHEQEWSLDKAVLDLCGIGLEPGMQQLHQHQRLSELLNWINTWQLSEDAKQQINQRLQQLLRQQHDTELPQVLSAEQLAFWQQQGYLVIPGVLSAEQCAQSRDVIWQYLEADPEKPDSWYNFSEKAQKIMLQIYRHPVLDNNRQTQLLRQIFEQLWQRTDLTMSTDRVSFNPPQTPLWQFPGPDMHWDVMLKSPVPFGTQGLIYLTDTTEQQGAFCCVPGFHLQIDHWINSQNKTEFEMQQQDWSAWPVKAIAAKAGDLIIWHQALPHGASVNRAAKPRMVQYVNSYPLQ